jgi:hypothetical protein
MREPCKKGLANWRQSSSSIERDHFDSAPASPLLGLAMNWPPCQVGSPAAAEPTVRGHLTKAMKGKTMVRRLLM